MSSRLMKTLSRQGARYQADRAFQNWEQYGMSWADAGRRAAAETLVCVVSPALISRHTSATRRRAHAAALRFTGWMPGAGDYGVVPA
jgi:hypothetical protein